MYKLRNTLEDDLSEIFQINEASIPAVNTVSIDEFKWFLSKKTYFKCAEDEDRNIVVSFWPYLQDLTTRV